MTRGGATLVAALVVVATVSHRESSLPREHREGRIGCGAHTCDARESYCEIVLSDVVALPSDFTCRPLPRACVPLGDEARTCDCFPENTPCRSFCGPLDGGRLAGFHLTCRR